MGEAAQIFGNGWELRLAGRGKYALELSVGGVARARFGRVGCGKFSELGSLDRKLRVHRTRDNLSVSAEMVNRVPFGCEYEIERQLTVADGLLDLTTAVAAVNFGRVGDLALEELSFPGAVAAELVLAGDPAPRRWENPAGELYCGAAAPLGVTVTFADGFRCQYLVGFDLWRHLAAERIAGANAEFRLTGENNELRLQRQVLRYDEGVEPEKRPWKFNALLVWMSDEFIAESVADEEFTLNGCPLSGIYRREFRRKLRVSPGNLRLISEVGKVCSEAAHLDRAGQGQLPHFDAAEYLRNYLWANNLLYAKGGEFTICPPPADQPKNLLAERLKYPLRPLPEVEEE